MCLRKFRCLTNGLLVPEIEVGLLKPIDNIENQGQIDRAGNLLLRPSINTRIGCRTRYSCGRFIHCALPFYINVCVDFHMAMVATAPQEKFLTGRRPVRNWTQLCCQSVIQMVTPYDIKLAYVQIITFVLRRINKNCCHQSCTFHSNMHQIVCRLRLRPDPTGGAYSAPPDP